MAVFGLQKKNDEQLRCITDEVVRRLLRNGVLPIYRIILYGSYATGTADDESDIDIMVLCDGDSGLIKKHERELRRSADRVGYENDIFIQTKVEARDHFDKWRDELPFFKSVQNDGVVLYG